MKSNSNEKFNHSNSSSFWKEAAIDAAIHSAAEYIAGSAGGLFAALTRFSTLNEGEDEILNGDLNRKIKEEIEREKRSGMQP